MWLTTVQPGAMILVQHEACAFEIRLYHRLRVMRVRSLMIEWSGALIREVTAWNPASSNN